MTNFEKYKDQITDLNFGVTKENNPVSCVNLKCCECIFYSTSKACEESLEWLKAEYEEPKINLPNDLPVDAKIEVSDDGKNWRKRHFAGFGGKNAVKAWCNGTTSWTSFVEETSWKYARLPKEQNNE